MKKIWIITFCLIWFNVIGQEKQVYSYPLSSLKQLPILQGCEDLKDSPDDNLECLKKTFEDMFIPYIKDLPKFAKQNALEVYIEFSLTEDGKISMPQRVTVSEEKMGDYVKEGYKQFRRDFIQNETKLTPGVGRNGKPVNTLFAIRIKKRLR